MGWGSSRGKPNPFDKYLGPEDIIQIQLCIYVLVQYPGILIHHSPNEGKRSPFEQYKLKRLGVSKGFPDLLLIYQGRILVVELKAGYNKPFKEQFDWLRAFSSCNIASDWFNSFEAAKEFIDREFR